MPRYRYKATNRQGERIIEEVTADDESKVRQLLESRGLKVDELEVIATTTSSALSSDESHEVTSRLAQLSGASLPLATGLRAAAEECGSFRVAQAMHDIANQVESGRSLDEIIANSGDLFPRYVSGLVLAATKTGKLGSALSELLEHQRSARSLRKSIMRGFAYPVFVVCLATIVLLVVIFGISEPYIRLFEDFQLELPLSTRLLIWWREYGLALMGCVLGGVLAVVGLLRLCLARATWSRIISRVPVFGSLAYWMGLAEWCSLLHVLVKNQIALPEALRLSAAGVENAYVGQIAATLAQRTTDGQSLSELLATNRPLPVSMVPLVRWGERMGLLDEAFKTAHELFDRRVRVRALMLQSALPPILFIIIACSVVMVLGSLFAPLTGLIVSLS